MRICGWLPVFEIGLFYKLFVMIAVNLILYGCCECFVAGTGGHRAGRGRGPAGNAPHRPHVNNLNKNPISKAEFGNNII